MPETSTYPQPARRDSVNALAHQRTPGSVCIVYSDPLLLLGVGLLHTRQQFAVPDLTTKNEFKDCVLQGGTSLYMDSL